MCRCWQKSRKVLILVYWCLVKKILVTVTIMSPDMRAMAIGVIDADQNPD